MAEPAEILTTDAEIEAALRNARRYEKYDRPLLKISYLVSSDRFRLSFADGSLLLLPRKLLQGLENATITQLREIQILGPGTGLLWPLIDVAHHVPSIAQGIYGTERWMGKLFNERPRPHLVPSEKSSVKTVRKGKRRTQ